MAPAASNLTDASAGRTISVTPAAVKEIIRLMTEHRPDQNLVLRLGVQGGGCSGLSYTMTFDHEVRQNDQVFECDGLKVVVDSGSLAYISGTTVDFSDELLTGGFKFSNPLARRGCGCGSSFAV